MSPDGKELSSRACRDETEAWTYASTVRQHVYWLSGEKFLEYYGLGGSTSERERASGSPQEQGSGGSRSERERASGSPKNEGSGG